MCYIGPYLCLHFFNCRDLNSVRNDLTLFGIELDLICNPAVHELGSFVERGPISSLVLMCRVAMSVGIAGELELAS